MLEVDRPTIHTTNGPQCDVAHSHDAPAAPQQMMICYRVSIQPIDGPHKMWTIIDPHFLTVRSQATDQAATIIQSGHISGNGPSTVVPTGRTVRMEEDQKKKYNGEAYCLH